MTASLDDVVVVDLSPTMPGHFCAMILGDLGARVIKVERPPLGDFSRSTIKGSFESVNRNKEGITLDLKQPEAKGVLRTLVARADVVIEGFRPGVVNRLGADYASLREIRPDLVYCSISGYGQDSPYRDVTGHDPNYLGLAGVLSLAGDPEGPPEGVVGASMADLSGAWFAAISVLAALRARDRFGVGQYIDVALADTSYALMQSRMVEYLVNGRPDKATLMSRPGIGAFEAADGLWLTVGAAEDHFWSALCQIVGEPAWAQDPRFATSAGRRQHGREIRERLRSTFRSRPRGDWLDALRAAGVPSGPVHDLGQAADDAHAAARGLVEWIDHPQLGRLPQVTFPARLSATPARIRRRPPMLGEHTADVLHELGYDDEAIERMRASGCV